jgi:peptide/nickel transport system ATP-binding protein
VIDAGEMTSDPGAEQLGAARRGALDVRSLSVTYAVGDRRLRALDSVSLAMPAGHRMAIVGESGSGKSTLGLALMGLLPRNSASHATHVSVDGATVDLASAKQLRTVRGRTMAMVFQDAKASLDPVRTIGSQVAEVLRVHKIVPRRELGAEVERLLAAVEIKRPGTVAQQYPHELSGGMRQRAMIATALAGRPALLIADEPTSALDVTTQATVIDLLRRIGDEGAMSTILITHDLALVAGFADSVTVMYAGEIVEIGSVDQVYGHPAHPYTRALLQSIPSIFDSRAHVLGSIPGSLPDLTQPVVGCVFEPRCPVGHGRDVCRGTKPELRALEGGSPQVACHFPFELPREREDGGDAAPVTVRPSEGTPPVLEMRSIVKTFHRRGFGAGRHSSVVAVGGVDLLIREGESVGVVGESGSGKTTLARILIGLERGDAGSTSIAVDGALQPVGKLPRDFAQFVFQDPGDSLNPLMSVGEIVSEPLVLRDGGRPTRYRDQVAALLDDVGLRASMASRRPSELSGGQRQRVAIARALSTRPKLIIADEAVASLDMSARGQILNLLARLQREHGFAYLYISHDLSMVRHVCDRVVVMYSGRVVETAGADALFAEPRHPYTQALISAVPVPDPAVERGRERMLLRTDAADAHLNDPQAMRTGCPFRFRCPLARERCEVETPTIAPGAAHGAACHFTDEAVQMYHHHRTGTWR